MAEKKLNNLLKFEEFDKLQKVLKPNSRTEVGGFNVSEQYDQNFFKWLEKTGNLDKWEAILDTLDEVPNNANEQKLLIKAMDDKENLLKEYQKEKNKK